MTPAERDRLFHLEQGSADWHEARRGCITASVAGRLLRITERGLPGFVDQIRADNGPGRDLSHVPEIRRGKEREDWARAQYEMRMGVEVRTCGLLIHPIFDLVRCSPDFLDPSLRGGGEIKCPTRREEHLFACAGTIPAVHVPQVQFSLWVSGFSWWDFISFRPEEPKRFQFACVRAVPDLRTFQKFERQTRLVLPYLDGGLH